MTHLPYRVVIDPNVIIAAAITRDEASPARVILQAATEGRVALIACPHLWDELVIALARRESVHTLLTGDKAVLVAPAPGVLIQTPRQFVDLLSATR